MAVGGARRAHPAGPEQGEEPCHGGGEAVRGQGLGAEQGELPSPWLVGMGGEAEAGDRRAGGPRLEVEAGQREQGLGVVGRGRELDAAGVVAVRLQAQVELQPTAGEAARFQAPAEPLEGGPGHEQEGLQGDEGPLQVHPFSEGGGRLPRGERLRVEPARDDVEPPAGVAEPARHLRLR